MIEGLRGKEMLGEFRGMRPVNMNLLVETTLKLSKLIEENPEIVELDVNPLLVGPDRVVAVDALIRIA
jgi:acetyltransferase